MDINRFFFFFLNKENPQKKCRDSIGLLSRKFAKRHFNKTQMKPTDGTALVLLQGPVASILL